MKNRRLVVFAAAVAPLFALRADARAQERAAGFDLVGEYTIEAMQGGTAMTGALVVVADGTSLAARLSIPDQPVLGLRTVRVDGRTVTLEDRLNATDIAFVLEFEDDDAFTGTWTMGPQTGTLSGRRGVDAALLPPACPDGPGYLPPLSPAPEFTPDPDAARIITSDVALFWDVLDTAPPETLATRLHCDYLRRGTDGLRDFISGRILNAERLAETVASRRERYEAARQSSLTIAAVEPRLRAMFHEMKAQYPEAVFPDIYFVMGRLNSGGTVSTRGLLIGAEMYTDHSGIPHIVAHELVHYQQPPIPDEQRTLLAQSIMEGSADFVAELISGRHTNEPTHEYALPRERELWAEFAQVMHGRDFTGWLYGNPPEGRPADLGYFFGYRIAQAYYETNGAHHQALREILTVTDSVGFLDASGYDPRRR